ncbi:hypothetical protein HDV05_008021 [Chytridiales sp. JEL 0842]|nr:hypothetical protein HDV05_008021 [Chytridiales sp. JEL 0842]
MMASMGGGRKDTKDKRSDQQGDVSLWSSILQEASASRTGTIAEKTILCIGDRGSGKSTIINALKQDPTSNKPRKDTDEKALALSYTYTEIIDDESEDIVARLGLYELDGDSAFGSLIQFSLTPKTLADTAVIICLDWTKPWKFLENLQRFFSLIERGVMAVAKDHAELFSTMQKRLETFIREYKEPEIHNSQTFGSTSKLDLAVSASVSQHSVLLPLSPGVLTHNMGVPIIVACNKADVMTSLEKDTNFNDDLFDFVQQCLRTLCLKYGAALFYVSSHRPATLNTLRSYVLYRLLGKPHSKAFSFPYKAQVVDRDTVCVPSGWDSWGMIKVQKESFDCEAVAEKESDGSFDSTEATLARAKAFYEPAIQDPYTDKFQASEPVITAEDEQAFLERNLDLLTSMSGGHVSGTASPSPAGPSAESFASRLSTSSMSSSDMLEDVSMKLARLAKLKEQSATSPLQRDKIKIGGDIPLPGSVTASLPSTGGTPASQNEVLANFFQSLLSKKTTGMPSSSGRAPSLAGRSPSSLAGASQLPSGDAANAGSPSGTGAGSLSPTNRQT